MQSCVGLGRWRALDLPPAGERKWQHAWHTIGLLCPRTTPGTPGGHHDVQLIVQTEGWPTVKLLRAAVLGAVFVAVGCGSPNAGRALLENVSTSAERTSTPVSVERSVDNEVTDGDQQFGIRYPPWLLVLGSVDEQSIPTEPDLVLRFGETVLFFPLSCNSGAVPYEMNGTSIGFDLDHFSTTEMRCAPDPTDQANLFETGLRRVETATMSPDGQQLELKGDGVSMQFIRGTGNEV